MCYRNWDSLNFCYLVELPSSQLFSLTVQFVWNWFFSLDIFLFIVKLQHEALQANYIISYQALWVKHDQIFISTIAKLKGIKKKGTKLPKQLREAEHCWWLTRVGVGVAISFSPLVRWSLVVEFVLRLNQRERVWDQGSTTHRLVVSQTTVTAAFLGAIREVKCNTALGLQRRAQDMLISALLFCSPDSCFLIIFF